MLFEDATANVLKESLSFFDEMMQSPIFQHTPVFVFLNKKDLFEQMIHVTPLRTCFPEYDGPVRAVEPAIDYIREKFRGILATHQPSKTAEFFVLSARNKEEARVAFDAVKNRLKAQVSK